MSCSATWNQKLTKFADEILKFIELIPFIPFNLSVSAHKFICEFIIIINTTTIIIFIINDNAIYYHFNESYLLISLHKVLKK